MWSPAIIRVPADAALSTFQDSRRLDPHEASEHAGFDDSDLASMISPALTTIRRPLFDMARAATEQLLQMIVEPGFGLPHRTLDLTLVCRQSTGRA